ncbi:MAG: hypothetical protein HYR96_11145 [Deltaproteobacteria bacterium]|nr:hypothetical protein [Deltaproteobacteria bacterium]MBI3293328.1 hypothetical protein [Deltaproteobacteria bacterium]
MELSVVPSLKRPRVVVIVALVFIGLVLIRQFFSCDFTDEALHLAMSYRFALGDTPFKDEYMSIQSAALLTLPIVRGFVHFNSGTEGIVLFSRLCFFLFSLSTTLAIYISLRRRVEDSLALMASLVSLAYVHYNIPNFFYNSISMHCLAAGLFLGTDERRWPQFAAGSFLATAAIAYPTLPIAIAVYVFLNPTVRTKQALFGASLIVFAMLPSLIGTSTQRLIEIIQYTSSDQDKLGGWHKWVVIARQITGEWWAPSYTTAILSIFWAGLRWSPTVWALIPILLIFKTPSHSFMRSGQEIFWFAILAPLFLPWKNRWWMAIAVASLVAGLTTAWTSSQTLYSAPLGLLPLAVLTVAYLTRSTCRLSWLPAAAAIFALVVALYQSSYRDRPLPLLTARLDRGPYKGIWTTAKRKAHYDGLLDEIRSLENDQGRIIFYDCFPGGYLMTKMKPATHSVWMLRNPGTRSLFTREYSASKSPHDIAVRIDSSFDGSEGFTTAAPDPFDEMITRDLDTVVQTESHRISVGRLPEEDTQLAQNL